MNSTDSRLREALRREDWDATLIECERAGISWRDLLDEVAASYGLMPTWKSKGPRYVLIGRPCRCYIGYLEECRAVKFKQYDVISYFSGGKAYTGTNWLQILRLVSNCPTKIQSDPRASNGF